jgi:hypothetical protein
MAYQNSCHHIRHKITLCYASNPKPCTFTCITTKNVWIDIQSENKYCLRLKDLLTMHHLELWYSRMVLISFSCTALHIQESQVALRAFAYDAFDPWISFARSFFVSTIGIGLQRWIHHLASGCQRVGEVD